MTKQTQDSLVDLTLTAFFDRLAARAPAPGGGATAAAAGALSAALGRMVLAYSIGKKTPDDARAQLTQWARDLATADANLRQLIDRDAAAYAAYAALIQRTDGEAANAQANAQAKAEALAAAMEVPLTIATVAERMLAVLQEAVPRASRWMYSDLEAAGILAEATVRCAGCSVRVNADQITDAALVEAARMGQDKLEASAAERLVGLRAALRSRRSG